jgi:hypothetical protein
MDDDQAAMMAGIRESYEWLLEWLELAISDKPDGDIVNRQLQLNFGMMDRAIEAPAVAGAAAVCAAATAVKALRLINDNAPDLAQQFVKEMRDDIDNAGTNHVNDTVKRYLG